jgi:superfamily II DNA or RNA helicase
MTVQLNEFSDTPLSAANSDELYDLYKAALEWQLSAPIIIRTPDDIISAERWRDRVQPFHHQVRNLITFCRLAPSVLLADEVGLGKTISAGLILSELVARRRVARALVVCPKVLCEQWVRELAEKFRIDAIAAAGGELLDAAHSDNAVVVTTYETSARYFSHPDMPTDAFQMLILDEAHRLRNLHGPNGPPRVASEIRKVIEARWFTYVLMLTATPIQNRFTDIYSLIDLLTLAKGHRNPFGGIKDFRSHYLMPKTDGRRLRPHMADRFRATLNGYITRTRRVDAELPFPSREVSTVRVTLIPDERIFESIIGEFVGELNPLQQSSLGQALMSSPAALAGQLENMSTVRPGLAAAATRARAVAEGAMPPAKLAHLYTICDELRSARHDWRVVVFTRRRETQEMIRRGLTARGIDVGLVAGGRAKENVRAISTFFENHPGVHVLISTDAGAEGINLQAANILVNYDLPWNPMVLEQRIGRIQRLGSLHRSVHIINLVAANTVEESVVARLVQRLTMVSETVGDLESILAGVDNGSEDGSGERFESAIRGLVVRSLQGQDIEQATELCAESIERARKDYEANCAQLNRDLGALNAEGTAILPPPTFDPPAPSMTAEQFVRRALAAEGRILREVSPGIFHDISQRGGVTRLAFSAAVADYDGANGPITLLVPGQSSFERLVERWAARRSHRVMDLRQDTDLAAEGLAREWCESYPDISFVSCVVRTRKSHIHGQVLVRTTAENRVDQHQSLVEYPVAPEGHRPILSSTIPSAPVFGSQVALQDISRYATLRIRAAVAENQDVNSFTNYYIGRRINELSRAGENPHLRQRVDDDFAVTISAGVVGFRGISYDETIIDVQFMVAGYQYTATLQAVPVFHQVIEQPTQERCSISGLQMPYGVLRRCDRSGRMVPRHLLFASEVSVRFATQEYCVVCDVTGRSVIDDEVEQCAVSGRLAIPSELVTCTSTGHRILRSESGISDVSGVIVRRDILRRSERPPYRQGIAAELVRCDSSGRWLLLDEAGVSALSGRIANLDLLHASEESGRLGLDEEMVQCEQTGQRLLQDEVDRCSVTGMMLNKQLLGQSEVSGRLASKVLLVCCAITGQLALREELEQCSLTGTLLLPEYIETCAVSGQRIMRSEMLKCEATGDWLTPSAAARSDISGRAVRPDLIRRSERPPHRAGLPDEMAGCEVSGKLLLLDELKCCEVSKRLASSDLLAICELTGAHVLPTELMVSELSQKYFRRDEQAVSDESGRVGHESETVVCSWSRLQLLLDEACESDFSRRSLAKSLAVESPISGRLAHPDEFLRCEYTQSMVLPDELEVSDVTGKRFRSDQAFVSKSARKGHCTEVGTCMRTNQQLLCDEIVRSAVSGLLVSETLALRSAVSDLHALPEEMGTCELTGARVLPTELTTSSISQKRFRCDEQAVSDESGRVGHESETVTCGWSGRRLLTDEACQSAASWRSLSKLLAVASPISGRLAHPDEFLRCEYTQSMVLPDELEVSDVTGKRFRSDQAFISMSRRKGHRTEVGTCMRTNQLLLSDEVVRSAVSGMMVWEALASRSVVSDLYALPEEMAVCELTGARVLPTELATSELSQHRFRCDERAISDHSHRLGHRSEFVKCAWSGRQLLMDEVCRSAVSKRYLSKSMAVASPISGRLAHPDEFQRCEYTQSMVLPDEINVSDLTGRRFRNDEVCLSDQTGRRGHCSEMATCAVSGEQLLKDEVERCVVTGKAARRDRMLVSSVSGRRMIPAAAVKSFRDGQTLCPDEAAYCHWNEGYLRSSETASCGWCELTFARELVSEEGIFEILPELLLDPPKETKEANAKFLELLRVQGVARLRAVSSACYVKSPKQGVLAVRAEVNAMFGLFQRNVVFMMSIIEGRRAIMGEITEVQNKGGELIAR